MKGMSRSERARLKEYKMGLVKANNMSEISHYSTLINKLLDEVEDRRENVEFYRRTFNKMSIVNKKRVVLIH